MAKISFDANLEPLISNFLREWNDSSDYITAYTSGSTGAPKQILLKKEDMRVSARATNEKFGINKESLLVSPLSVEYIAGKMMLVRALEAGCEIKMLKPSLKLDLNFIDRNISLLPIVPTQLDSLMDNPGWCNRIDAVIIGGGALSEQQKQQVVNVRYNAYATYGMTETCSHVAVQKIGCETGYSAMPNISFSVDSESCLVIESNSYSWRKLITNDVVRLIDDKHFCWIGRRDFIINTGGIKVSPEKVEQQLGRVLNCPFYVKGEPSEQWGNIVVLYLETTEEINQHDVIEKCRSVLPKYSVPKKVVAVRKFNYTSSGKIKRDSF